MIFIMNLLKNSFGKQSSKQKRTFSTKVIAYNFIVIIALLITIAYFALTYFKMFFLIYTTYWAVIKTYFNLFAVIKFQHFVRPSSNLLLYFVDNTKQNCFVKIQILFYHHYHFYEKIKTRSKSIFYQHCLLVSIVIF